MLPSVYSKNVGVLILEFFGAQYPAHLCPCLRFAVHLAVPQCKTRGRADRYSFPVRLAFSTIHAGLSRRTRISLLVHHCGSVPVHHTHQSLQSKMQSAESSSGNLRLSARLLPPEPLVVTQPKFTRVKEPTLLCNQVGTNPFLVRAT